MSPWRQQTAAHPKNMSDLWNIHNSLLTITWHIFKVECHLVSYYNVSYYNKLTKKYYLRMFFVTFSIFLEHSSNNHTESWIIKQYQTCNFHSIILTYYCDFTQSPSLIPHPIVMVTMATLILTHADILNNIPWWLRGWQSIYWHCRAITSRHAVHNSSDVFQPDHVSSYSIVSVWIACG